MQDGVMPFPNKVGIVFYFHVNWPIQLLALPTSPWGDAAGVLISIRWLLIRSLGWKVICWNRWGDLMRGLSLLENWPWGILVIKGWWELSPKIHYFLSNWLWTLAAYWVRIEELVLKTCYGRVFILLLIQWWPRCLTHACSCRKESLELGSIGRLENIHFVGFTSSRNIILADEVVVGVHPFVVSRVCYLSIDWNLLVIFSLRWDILFRLIIHL